ncbi:hypothetical protein [Agrobacterium tumefaciens]|uniref:hypothetical protein n=1 Tax=Agrobacterium tumefaciens TaxID=358 RepID=UPI003B9ED418
MKPETTISGFTAPENKLHTRFAVRAVATGGWDNTSAAFLAMQRECSARSLRACNFRQFRSRIRSMRGYHLFWSPRFPSNDLSDPPAGGPLRATSVASLLRAIDNASIGGW